MTRQTTPYTLQQYLQAGCETLTRDGKIDLIGAGIHGVTSGMPCNGCHAIRGCAALAKLRVPILVARAAPPAETVRQEAERRGISIGEVRRQRHAA